MLHLFECNPRFVALLGEQAKLYSNVFLVPSAVSDFEGRTTCYVNDKTYGGTSSLLETRADAAEVWKGRTDKLPQSSIDVPVTTLAAYMAGRSIDAIECLYVDAQGSDMAVLQGLGERIDAVHSGMLEAPSSTDTRVYAAQDYDVTTACEWLRGRGFTVDAVLPNDRFGARGALTTADEAYEVKVYFSRLPALPDKWWL